MNSFQEIFNNIGKFVVNSWSSIVFAIILLITFGILIKLLGKLLMKIVYSTNIDNASGGFFVALIKVILWIILIFATSTVLGIDGNSFLVAFSSIALAVGLALKDSLSNIANGIVIVMVKPFKKGDYVAIGSIEGIVKKISILTTELVTVDNKKIVVPNNSVTSSNIINYSSNPTRRIDLTYSVSYSSDMKIVKKVLTDAVNNYKYTIFSPAPVIFMESHSASSIDFRVRFYVNTSDYWDAYYNFNEVVFDKFKENNIEIPFNQLDVHIINGDKNA